MASDHPRLSRFALWSLLPLTVLTMFPVTGVVPILKSLIKDHYGANDLETSLFMSVNMVGALLTAPLIGWVSDRSGRTKSILIVCAFADALLWFVLSTRPPFFMLMLLRLFEGAAHIGVLSMLMALMSHVSTGEGRRSRMAAMGGAVIFGVAIGAPLGGILGRNDPTLPLHLGAIVMVVVALATFFLIPSGVGSSNPKALPKWPKLYAPKKIRLPYLFSFIDRLTVGVFVILFPLYTVTLDLGPSQTGLLIGAFMMTFTLLSYPAGRLAERIGLWRLMLIGSFCFAIAYGCVPWLDGPMLWLDMVLCGFFSALMFGPNLMLVVRGSTEKTRASAMAGFNAAGSLGFLIGPLVGGGLVQLLKNVLPEMTVFYVVFAGMGLLEVSCVGLALLFFVRGKSTDF